MPVKETVEKVEELGYVQELMQQFIKANLSFICKIELVQSLWYIV